MPTKQTPRAIERDPRGISLHTPGAKADGGKNRIGLMMSGFVGALEGVAKVSTLGAEKYSDHGWMEVPDGIARYTDAMMRHQFAIMSGEVMDTALGVPHADCVAWNALAISQLHRNQGII